LRMRVTSVMAREYTRAAAGQPSPRPRGRVTGLAHCGPPLAPPAAGVRFVANSLQEWHTCRCNEMSSLAMKRQGHGAARATFGKPPEIRVLRRLPSSHLPPVRPGPREIETAATSRAALPHIGA